MRNLVSRDTVIETWMNIDIALIGRHSRKPDKSIKDVYGEDLRGLFYDRCVGAGLGVRMVWSLIYRTLRFWVQILREILISHHEVQFWVRIITDLEINVNYCFFFRLSDFFSCILQFSQMIILILSARVVAKVDDLFPTITLGYDCVLQCAI